MAKTNSSFKLGKMVKLTLSTIDDKESRRLYLKAMVDSQQSFMESKNKKFSELRSAQPKGDSRQPQQPAK